MFARVIPSIWGVSKKVFGNLYNCMEWQMRNPQIYTDLAAKTQFKVLPTEGGEAAVQSSKFKVQKKQITTNFPQIFSPADFADLADKAA